MGITLGMACLLLAGGVAAAEPAGAATSDGDDVVQPVIDEVEKACVDRTVYMVGRKKAERLAELVREAEPGRVVECGTALGYSSLWIGRELKRAGTGKLLTIEINPERAKEAEGNLRRAGLSDTVTVKVGDAKQVAQGIEGPIDFLFIDCGAPNYFPIFRVLEPKLKKGATVVADNAGISAGGMRDYLEHVRSKHTSRTEWFDIDLPWAKRDAIEVTVISP